MNRITDEEIIERVQQGLQEWILQQRILELENSLSNIIMFFSVVLAIIALIFALIAWWMRKIFEDKLNSVKTISNVANDTNAKSQAVYNKLHKEAEVVDKQYKKIMDWVNDKKNSNERIKGLEEYMFMIEEALRVEILHNTFIKLDSEIKRMETLITEEAILTFQWEEPNDGPMEEYKFLKSFYLEAIEEFNKVSSLSMLDFEKFIITSEDEGVRTISDELNDSLADTQKFFETLKKII